VTTLQAATKQIKALVARWEDDDGEFARYYMRRSDTLKMLGAGNAAGALGVAAFLTSTTRTGKLVVPAKICLALFFVGLVAFIFAYRRLYFFGCDIEDALTLLRGGKTPDDGKVSEFISSAAKRSESVALLNLAGFWGLFVGAFICFAALLIK
jgi:hypothetical protein